MIKDETGNKYGRFITVSENSRRANIHRYHGNTEVN